MIWVLGALLYLADRVSKWLSLTYLEGKEAIEVIPGFFQLHFATNNGAAFGLMGKWGHMMPYVALVAVMLLLLLLWRYEFSKGEQLAIIMIITGALGNMTDRIIYGYVVDMMEFTFINFAVFNIADVCITIGCIFLIVKLLFSKKDLQKRERAK